MKPQSRLFLLFSVAFFLLSGIAVSAQSAADLPGIWEATVVESENEVTITGIETFVLGENMSLSDEGYVHCSVSKDGEEIVRFEILYSVNGVWSLDGDLLTFKYDKKSVKIKDGEYYGPSVLKGMIINPLKSELKKSMSASSAYKILSYEGSSMKVIDTEAEEPTELNFKRL